MAGSERPGSRNRLCGETAEGSSGEGLIILGLSPDPLRDLGAVAGPGSISVNKQTRLSHGYYTFFVQLSLIMLNLVRVSVPQNDKVILYKLSNEITYGRLMQNLLAILQCEVS